MPDHVDVAMTEIFRMTAFSDHPDGGNPAGVVLEGAGLTNAEMLDLAAEVGFSETAFVLSGPDSDGAARLRFFSPLAEVPFCGHATVATAVLLAERTGQDRFSFDTPAGEISLRTRTADGVTHASFTSVEPWVRELENQTLIDLLTLLGIHREDLDPRLPPRESFAGNPHPVLAVRDAEVFDSFDVDPQAVRRLMDAQGWTGTVTVVHRMAPTPGSEPPGPLTFEARNIFPVGEITEDPATGSAAASVGAWLRSLGAVSPPEQVVIHQGRHVGRPSVLLGHVPEAGGITVTGTATLIR